MPQVFRPRANALAIALLVGAALMMLLAVVVVLALGRSPYSTGVGYQPEQPVPFSHKHHAGSFGIDCLYCHGEAERSRFAGIPPTHVCMTCHSQLWTDVEMLAPIRRSLETGQPLRWVRVHDLADFVYFDHRAHVTSGVGCESCHGRVDQMPLTRQARPLTMQWCLDCHRDPGPHLRPADKITAMGYDPTADDLSAGELLMRYGVDANRLTECYTCHR